MIKFSQNNMVLFYQGESLMMKTMMMKTIMVLTAGVSLLAMSLHGGDPKWDGFATVDDQPDVRSGDAAFALDARAWTQTESIQWLADVSLGMPGFLLLFK